MSQALLQAWEATLRRNGRRRAVVQAADGQAASFRELDSRAAAWCETQVPDPRSLRGRAVVFAAANSLGWFEVFLGLLKAGAVAVPLDPAEPLVEQRRLAVALRAAAWWDGGKLEALAGARRYRDPEVSLIKLTSGTTGQPRALVFTAGQLLADARQVTASMGIRRHDLNYALIPLGHSYGLGNLVVPLVAHGIPLVCGTAPLPHVIAADFARWRPTVFPGVPVLWRALAGSDLVLRGLRLAISAGAPLAPAVARDFAARFGTRIHGFYGSSETGGISFDRSGAATLTGGVGGAMRGVTLTALGGRRLRVSSPAVLTHGNRQRSGQLGAWLMPDCVERGVHGMVTLLGRRGASVKIAGRRVNLEEIGGRLRRLKGVREAWVGTGGGADPVLGAVVATERSVSDLRAMLQTDTAGWKIPKRWAVVSALPVTARGKTDTRALRAMIA